MFQRIIIDNDFRANSDEIEERVPLGRRAVRHDERSIEAVPDIVTKF